MDKANIPEGILSDIQQQLAMLRDTVDTLTVQNQRKDEEIERLNQMLLNMQRARFGQTSEKRTYVLGDGTEQLTLFESAETGASGMPQVEDASQGDPAQVPVAGHCRKKKRTLEELCASLPVEECIVDLPEEEKQTQDGKPLICIGQEYVRTELVVERAKAKVVKHYRKVYADREQEDVTGCTEIFKPVMPAPLLPHSYVSASVATEVLVRKYVDAMPLYRQEQMWKRIGVELKRNTMANWAIQIAESYLQPFWEHMRQALVLQSAMHVDESVLQVLKEEGRPPSAESRMWVYASTKRADIQIRCFDYKDSRNGECAKAFLEGFEGILISDGYSGYNKVPNVIRAGCWAHARRKWFEAMPKGATVSNSKAAWGYELCNRLFAVERELENLSSQERQRQRAQRAEPILNEYWAWLDTIFQPTGKLKDAVTYSRNQKEHLCTFLSHGEIEIHNNQVENAIRPFVVGRKGWLFADTPKGAQASAILYSVMETAKANALNLELYIQHLLTVLPDRFAVGEMRIDDLLPWDEGMRELFSLEPTGH
jgi:transposase